MERPGVYEGLAKYIASLSEEERERYKDLIEEAIERDRMMTRHFAEGMMNAEKFAESMRCIIEIAADLRSDIAEMNEKLLDIRDTSEIITRVMNSGPSLN